MAQRTLTGIVPQRLSAGEGHCSGQSPPLQTPPGRLLRLSAAHGQLEWSPADLCPGRYTIGSGPDCDLVIDVEGVAARHCTLLVTPHRSILKAWSSRTWINEGVVTEATLRPGDRLVLGPVELKVEIPGTPAAFEAPESDLAELLSASSSAWGQEEQFGTRKESQIRELLTELQQQLDVVLRRERDFHADASRQRTILQQRAAELEQQIREQASRQVAGDAAQPRQLSGQETEVEHRLQELSSREAALTERHADLADRASALAIAHRALRSQITEIERRENDLQNVQQLFSKQENFQKNELSRIRAQMRQLELQTVEFHRLEESVLEQRKQLHQERETFELEVKAFQNEKRKWENRCRSRERIIEDFERNISVRGQEIEEDEARIAELVRQMSDKDRDVQDRMLRLEAIRTAVEQSNLQCRQREQEQLAQQQQLDDRQQSLDQQTDELQQERLRLESLKAELDQRSLECAERESQVHAVEVPAEDAALLEAQRLAIVREAEAENEAERLRLRQLREELDAESQRLADLQRQVRDERDRLAETREQLSAKEHELETLVKQRASENSFRRNPETLLDSQTETWELDGSSASEGLRETEEQPELCAESASSTPAEPTLHTDHLGQTSESFVSDSSEFDAQSITADQPDSPEAADDAAIPAHNFEERTTLKAEGTACAEEQGQGDDVAEASPALDEADSQDAVIRLRGTLASLFGMNDAAFNEKESSGESLESAEQLNPGHEPAVEASTVAAGELAEAEASRPEPCLEELRDETAQDGGSLSGNALSEESTPAEAVSASHAESSEEFSVESYMANLLARTRQKLEEEDSTATVSSFRAKPVEVSPAPPSEQDPEAVVRKARKLNQEEKASLRANLHSFRAVANSSARAAVAKFHANRKASTLRALAIGSGLSWTATAALLLSENWLKGSQQLTALGLAGVSTVLSFLTAVRYREIRRFEAPLIVPDQTAAPSEPVAADTAADASSEEDSPPPRNGPLAYL